MATVFLFVAELLYSLRIQQPSVFKVTPFLFSIYSFHFGPYQMSKRHSTGLGRHIWQRCLLGPTYLAGRWTVLPRWPAQTGPWWGGSVRSRWKKCAASEMAGWHIRHSLGWAPHKSLLREEMSNEINQNDATWSAETWLETLLVIT